MKLGIVVYSNHLKQYGMLLIEGISLNKKDEVKVFLMAEGVEAESLSNKEFNILEQMHKFLDANGTLLACELV